MSPSSVWQDPASLRAGQYRDSANLNARIALHARFSTNSRSWFAWLFDRLPPALGGWVLDAGAGAGTFWHQNRQRVPAAVRVCLTDLSEGMVAEAAAILRTAGAGWFGFAVADSQHLPFADGVADVVLANHMLYHVPDRAAAIRELRRVLRTGGVLIASTTGEAHMAEIDERLRRLGVAAEHLGYAVAAPFTLENGAAQLACCFEQVEVHRYEDRLVVTEVEPLMAYVRSMLPGAQLADSGWRRLEADFAGEIAAKGAVRITKDSGVFVAWTAGAG
jgi:ubiquinone/menaquinone biosynthesis C-methylase UbiE